MGRYATREDAVDRLLRGKVFVDLYAVVRRAVYASVESYSLKQLEPFYGFERETSLPDGNGRFNCMCARTTMLLANIACAVDR